MMALTIEEKKEHLRDFAREHHEEFLEIVLTAPDATIEELFIRAVAVYTQKEAEREAGAIDWMLNKPKSPFVEALEAQGVTRAQLESWVAQYQDEEPF